MNRHRHIRLAALVLVALLALTAGALSGCGGSKEAAVQSGPSALGSLGAARSALSTMAPDAKLLVVQTAQAATATSTPVWVFLFGSPSNDKTFAVYTQNGQTMAAQEYGTAGLTDEQWGQVPGTGDLKVDSDDAYAKAVAAGGAKGDPAGYMMGLTTYKPAEDTSTVQPFVWQVQFDPGESGATTGTITVDAKTGAASAGK